MSDRNPRGGIVVGGAALFAAGVLVGAALFVSAPQPAPLAAGPLFASLQSASAPRTVADNFDTPALIRLDTPVTPGTALKIVVQMNPGAYGYITLTDRYDRGLPLALTDRGPAAISLGLESGLSVVTVALTPAQPSTPGLEVRVTNGNGYNSVFGLPSIHTHLGDLVALRCWGTGYSIRSVQVVAAPIA